MSLDRKKRSFVKLQPADLAQPQSDPSTPAHLLSNNNENQLNDYLLSCNDSPMTMTTNSTSMASSGGVRKYSAAEKLSRQVTLGEMNAMASALDLNVDLMPEDLELGLRRLNIWVRRLLSTRRRFRLFLKRFFRALKKVQRAWRAYRARRDWALEHVLKRWLLHRSAITPTDMSKKMRESVEFMSKVYKGRLYLPESQDFELLLTNMIDEFVKQYPDKCIMMEVIMQMYTEARGAFIRRKKDFDGHKRQQLAGFRAFGDGGKSVGEDNCNALDTSSRGSDSGFGGDRSTSSRPATPASNFTETSRSATPQRGTAAGRTGTFEGGGHMRSAGGSGGFLTVEAPMKTPCRTPSPQSLLLADQHRTDVGEHSPTTTVGSRIATKTPQHQENFSRTTSLSQRHVADSDGKLGTDALVVENPRGVRFGSTAEVITTTTSSGSTHGGEKKQKKQFVAVGGETGRLMLSPKSLSLLPGNGDDEENDACHLSKQKIRFTGSRFLREFDIIYMEAEFRYETLKYLDYLRGYMGAKDHELDELLRPSEEKIAQSLQEFTSSGRTSRRASATESEVSAVSATFVENVVAASSTAALQASPPKRASIASLDPGLPPEVEEPREVQPEEIAAEEQKMEMCRSASFRMSQHFANARKKSDLKAENEKRKKKKNAKVKEVEKEVPIDYDAVESTGPVREEKMLWTNDLQKYYPMRVARVNCSGTVARKLASKAEEQEILEAKLVKHRRLTVYPKDRNDDEELRRLVELAKRKQRSKSVVVFLPAEQQPLTPKPKALHKKGPKGETVTPYAQPLSRLDAGTAGQEPGMDHEDASNRSPLLPNDLEQELSGFSFPMEEAMEEGDGFGVEVENTEGVKKKVLFSDRAPVGEASSPSRKRRKSPRNNNNRFVYAQEEEDDEKNIASIPPSEATKVLVLTREPVCSTKKYITTETRLLDAHHSQTTTVVRTVTTTVLRCQEKLVSSSSLLLLQQQQTPNVCTCQASSSVPSSSPSPSYVIQKGVNVGTRQDHNVCIGAALGTQLCENSKHSSPAGSSPPVPTREGPQESAEMRRQTEKEKEQLDQGKCKVPTPSGRVHNASGSNSTAAHFSNSRTRSRLAEAHRRAKEIAFGRRPSWSHQ